MVQGASGAAATCHAAGFPENQKNGGFPRRGVAEGPRKTPEPTLNAGKQKRRPNKNETTDGKTTPGATKNKKSNAERGKRNRRRKTTPNATKTKKATTATRTLSAERRL